MDTLRVFLVSIQFFIGLALKKELESKVDNAKLTIPIISIYGRTELFNEVFFLNSNFSLLTSFRSLKLRCQIFDFDIENKF